MCISERVFVHIWYGSGVSSYSDEQAKRPTFSVVIPAYNAAGTLAGSLRALAACEPPPREIIVVDDASTDTTSQIAEAAAVEVMRHSSNQGASGARNTGAAAAVATVTVFVDADVSVPTDTFARLYEWFSQDRPPTVVCGVYSAECPADRWVSQHKNLYSVDMNAPLGDWATTLNSALAAIPREVLMRYGGFDTRWPAAEDTELAMVMAAGGERIVFDHDIEFEHMKEFTLAGLLRDDWKKSYWLGRQVWARGAGIGAELRSRERNHHGLARLLSLASAYALAFLVPTALLTGSALVASSLLTLAALHAYLNRTFYRLLTERLGLAAMLRSAVLYGIELLIGGAAIVAAWVDHRRNAVSPVQESA